MSTRDGRVAPDHDWPPRQRRLARLVRAMMYATAAAAGAAVLVWPPSALTAQLGVSWVHALGALAFVSGATTMGAALRWRWQLEWVAVSQLTGAYTVYTGLEWLVVGHQGGGHLATALILTAFTAALAARAIDLWVFSLTTSRARRLESPR